jgi:Mor family transcriptional regulator
MSPSLRELIGEEAYKALCGTYGGSRIYVPKPDEHRADKGLVQELYTKRRQEGLDKWVIIRELAMQFGRSEVRIYQIIEGKD